MKSASRLLVGPVAWGLAACATDQPQATPEAMAPPPGIQRTQSEASWRIGPSVDPAVVAAIRAGVRAGEERFGRHGPLVVYVLDGADDNAALVRDFAARCYRPADERSREEQLASAIEHFEVPASEGEVYLSPQLDAEVPFAAMVFVNAAPPPGQSNLGHEATMAAHEYAHLYQAAFPHAADTHEGSGVPGPAWIAEGAASYFALANGVERGWIEGELHEHLAAVDAAYRAARAAHGLGLRMGETYHGVADELVHAVVYDGGCAAVAALIELAGAEAFWEEYYERLPREGWEAAFEHSFGLTPAAFYARFDAP